MTDIQQKLFDLLTDLDNLCKRENIAYYLCAETVHAAVTFGQFHPNCCQASVAMTPADARKFIAAVNREGRKDRITDSMHSNKYYPDFTVRYCDPNTMMMQLPYNIDTALPCIGVTIHMIRRKPKHLAAFYSYSTKFWKVCLRPSYCYGGTLVKTAVTICHGLKAVLGGKYFGRWLFNRWSDLFSSNKNSKKISICTDKFQFSRDLVKRQSIVTLEGQEFTTFSDPESYLKEAYGENFLTHMPKYAKPSATLLLSTHVSFERYLETAKAKGLDLEQIKQNKFRYDVLQGEVSRYNRKIDKYYAIVDRTDKRFAMWEMYMPMKEQLLQLHKEKKYEELNELLTPYLSALQSCYQKKLGLCFDKEIFEITMDLLLQEGSTSYVEKLRAMVPEQHWNPMVVTNYKGEPV